ncbi:hypothetical protein HDE_03608 [Halotydeus destructor]|nr:hypothetical protein HDE_03608 [Halotydeus destructor]
MPKKPDSMENFNIFDFSDVKSFLGNYSLCWETVLQQKAVILPAEAFEDSKIYVLKYGKPMPWNLSKLTFIYSSFPDVVDFSAGIEVYVTFERFSSKILPAPYDTFCHNYDQYKCVYDCSQASATSTKCLRACAKPSCSFSHLVTLAHISLGVNTSSRVVIEQDGQVRSTEAEAKMSLGFILLNVFGLLGVFFGLSVLSVTMSTWRLFAVQLRLAKKALIMVCLICACTQCLVEINNHLEYHHLVEAYQGSPLVTPPKVVFSACLNRQASESWVGIMAPKFRDIVYEMQIALYKVPEVIFLLNDSFLAYESECVSTYSISFKSCFLLPMPEKRFGAKWYNKRSSLLGAFDLRLMFSNPNSFYEVSANTDDFDIMYDDTRIKNLPRSSIQNIYIETLALPQPYATDCQHHGRGVLSAFKSRHQCINACALKRFQELNPDHHPINIPVFDTSNKLHIAGDAQGYLDYCRDVTCRWVDCKEERFKLYSVRQTVTQIDPIFTLNSPQQHVYRFKHVPVSLIIDTLLVIISTIGFWAGVSVLQLISGVKKVSKFFKARKSHRTALKITRHIILISGLLWNLTAAFEKYLAYETLTQSYSQPASNSRLNLVLFQETETPCLGNGGCSSSEISNLADKCSKQSGQLVSAIWSRDFEDKSWVQLSVAAQSLIVKTYLYFRVIVITELRLSKFTRNLDKEQLAASGSAAILKIDLASAAEVGVQAIDSFDNIDVNVIASSITEMYPGQRVIYEFDGVTVSSLPSPYIFECIDYPRYGHKNQKRCFDSCMEKLFSALYNKKNSAVRPLAINELSQSTEDELGWYFIFNQTNVASCEKRCRKSDCKTNVYSTRQNSLLRPDNRTTLEVNSQTHETSIKHVPKMIVSAFIMYLGNTFGLWYGVCFTDLLTPALYLCSMIIDSIKQ